MTQDRLPLGSMEGLVREIVACQRCPRLVAYREEVARSRKRQYADWEYWGRPVPPFGDPEARLLVVGLAPAAHGGNRTGRVFTGDSSGDFLFRALHRAGFANQPTSRRRDDGLRLTDAYVTAVARCAPPQNRPAAEELANCRGYLRAELDLLTRLEVVICLGQVALDGYLRAQRERGHEIPRLRFGHGAAYDLEGLPRLIASYHPSRRNTNTGLLSEVMFDEIFARARASLR